MSDRSLFRASPEQLAACRRVPTDTPVHPYWSQLELELAEPLTAAELERRLSRVIAEEEVLRTELERLPGLAEPAQHILEPEELAPSADLETLCLQPRAAALRVRLSTRDWRQLWLAAPSSHADGPSLRSVAARLIGEAAAAVPGLQHADYAEWKHELLESLPPPAAVEHYRELARESPARLALALESESHVGAPFELVRTEEVQLDAARGLAISRLAASWGCDGCAILLSLYAALLSRLADQDAVLVGYDDGSRSAALAGAVGPYAASLPLALTVDRTRSLVEVVQAVVSACEQSHAHRDGYDFATDCAYAFAALGHSSVAGARVIREHSVCSRFKLRLTARQTARGFSYAFDYDRQVFSAEAIECIEEQWRAILAATEQPQSRPLASVELLGRRQRSLSPAAAPALADACSVLQLFERHALSRGNAIAVVDESGPTTYQALDLLANRLARVLRERGAGPGHVIALLLPRIRDALVTILAAHKLGAAYLPLDPEYPPDRLRFMLEDSGAKLCVCTRELRALCAEVESVCVESLDAALDAAPLPRQDCLDVLAYLIYTSGSTGTPKGVAVTQRSLSHSTQVRMAFYSEPVRAYLLLSSFAFDSSVAGIFWTIAQGGTLVLPSTRDIMEPSALAALCLTHGISHGLSLPSVYDALLEQPQFTSVTSLTTWIVAGEECTGAVIDKHRSRLPRVRLFNEYGPTEATVWATVEDVSQGATPRSIGKPIRGMQLAVVNPSDTLCGIGEPGEIVLGGPSLALGYHRRPELTAERFAVHPRLGTRVYRTGDRGCVDVAGRVLFLGRIDRQVKVRGQRVELAEIERCLASDARVFEAVVLARTDATAQLLAFVRSDCPAETLAPALRARVQQALPRFMHPQSLHVLSALPRTPNGKLDVEALLGASERPAGSYEAPAGEVETALCQVCAELLRLPRVGATSDFFELGGDSILSLQLCARAAARGVTVTVREVFEHKVLRDIARVARRTQSAQERELQLALEYSFAPSDAALLEAAASRYRMHVYEVVAALLAKTLPLSRLVVEQPLAANGGGTSATYRTAHELAASAVEWAIHLRAVKAALRAPSEDTPALTADAWLSVGESGTANPRCRAPLKLALTSTGSSWFADPAQYTPELLAACARTFGEQLAELAEHCASTTTAELDARDFPNAGLDARGLAALLTSLER